MRLVNYVHFLVLILYIETYFSLCIDNMNAAVYHYDKGYHIGARSITYVNK
jgi:hypothetical protein